MSLVGSYAGDQRIAMRDGVNRLHYYLNDHLGSARVVIDSSGNIKDKYHYLAFGSPLDVTTGTGQPNKYTGKPYDMDAGMNLYYYGARYYDSDGGRFTQIDPLRNKYPEWGPYVYCADNPIRVLDPDGKEWIECRTFYVTRPELTNPTQRDQNQVHISMARITTYHVHWNTAGWQLSKWVPIVGIVPSYYEFHTDANAMVLDGLKLAIGPLLRGVKAAVTSTSAAYALGTAEKANDFVEKSESIMGIDDPRVVALFESRYGDMTWTNQTSLELAIKRTKAAVRKQDEDEKEKFRKEEAQKKGSN